MTPQVGWLLLAAACAGGFVGLVKQWKEGTSAVAGVRTFSLWAVLGFVAAQLDQASFPGLMLTAFVLLGSGVVLFSFTKKPDGDAHFGLTTLVSAPLMFLVGALIATGRRDYGIVLCVLVAGILGLRDVTHRWSTLLTEVDIRATLQFTFFTGVILPLVPDKVVLGLFNPYDTWRMVLLISGVNLLGYAAMRLLGAKAGLPITGIVGGLASSTAVTLAFSRKSREEPGHDAACAQAILLANQSMFARVWVVILALCPAFAWQLFPAFLLVTLTGLAVPAWLMRHASVRSETEVPVVKNPLRLGVAVKFGLLYAILVFILAHFGHAAAPGTFIGISFLSGLLTMDAITVSLANNIPDAAASSTLLLPMGAVLAAMAANTMMKMGIALYLGNAAVRRWVVLSSIITLASIGVAWGAIWAFA
ncbi:MAG: DUF4010 domain-containing protein [Puniceicoccales bacterium]|nr:DUF4010 domain-containing protein [Puniceicoccales bacterium]